MKRHLFFATLLALLSLQVSAQSENLKMRFNFENVSGTNVTDEVSGITAKLCGSAKVMEMGDYQVLDLGSNAGYLDMTAEAGKVFAACEDHTISVYYYVNEQASLSGNGYFLWAFSTQAACTADGGAYSAYRLNAQRIASSAGGYKGEIGASVDAESDKGRWMHVAYTQTGKVGKLYIDGVLKKSIANMPLNSVLYATKTPSCCWIGRAPFSADNYLSRTLVSDFCLYDSALSAEDIKTLADKVTVLDDAYIHGTTGDASELKTVISEAKGLLEDATSYLPDAVSELKNMLEMADVVAGGAYSQTYINRVCEQLREIVVMVKASSGIILPDVDDIATDYDTQRGFIHPGGLHTQADFDRVKRQLAEGNEKVTAAYNVLKSAEYAQPGIATWPVETIVRGGGVGENYINAARGATMAYQNALRWKIEDNKACANAAVRILMAWANTTKAIGGDSNYALAAGLYGYQFAQAAELMRDYEGWSSEDFATFKQWMLSVWYPSSIGFLRGRNGTWENAGKWWQAPGHYWSNWGLCNALCVISIGVLCDDVYIYNQGMSYFKYDQVGNFHTPRTDNPIKNDGLTEFLGNLVVTHVESSLQTGAYGKLGQMNESGRDTGHSAMALGLAVDIAKVGWSQGDDLFSYMDHRLAAGIEYVAAQTQSVTGLPWTDYAYGTNGYYYTDNRVWVMTEPALGAQMRPYWGTVIGVYEGVKGVKMPFSENSYKSMGIDAGGQGSTSGGYDHLGYSVLMNTHDVQLAPADKVPTELSAKMEYSGTLNNNLIPSMAVERKLGNINGKEIAHNELGGLVNTYTVNNRTCVPQGETVKLMPQLPAGEEDTGLWEWETGETTRDITVATDRSYIYRVTYTNVRGVKSQLSFPIAVENSNIPTVITPCITYNGENVTGIDTVHVVYGESVTLSGTPSCGWGTYQWSTGQTTQSITTAPIVAPATYTLYYTNQASVISKQTFYIDVMMAEPYIQKGEVMEHTSECIVDADESVTLGLLLPTVISADDVLWSTGERGDRIVIENPQNSETYTATFTFGGETMQVDFTVLVRREETRILENGNYLLYHVESGRLLTAHGLTEPVTFEPGDAEHPESSQIWYIAAGKNGRHSLTCLADSLSLLTNGKMGERAVSMFYFEQPIGSERVALRVGVSSSARTYWTMTEEGTLDMTATALEEYPFRLIPVSSALGIEEVETLQGMEQQGDGVAYDLQGRKIDVRSMGKGLYIVNGKKVIKR